MRTRGLLSILFLVVPLYAGCDLFSSRAKPVDETPVDEAPLVDAGGPYVARMNWPVYFAPVASDSGDTIVLYEWDFDGDGTYDWSNPDSGAVTHVYTTAGDRVAIFRATDDAGNAATDTARFAVALYPWKFGAPPRPGMDGDGWAMAIGECMYVFGGYSRAAAPGSYTPAPFMEVYDTANDAWSFGPSVPWTEPIWHVAAAGGTIYAVGGGDFATLEFRNALYAYDIATGAWTTKRDIPGKSPIEVTVLRDTLYAIVYDTVAGNSLAKYDPVPDTWMGGFRYPDHLDEPSPRPTTGTPMPFRLVTRYQRKPVAIGGRLYFRSNYPALDSVLIYDPALDPLLAGGG